MGVPDPEREPNPFSLEGGDPVYFEVLKDLAGLHVEKSSTYGTNRDRFDNFKKVAVIRNQDELIYPLERIVEKSVRAFNMVESGNVLQVVEFLDVAGLAVCGEAMLRVRLRGG